MLTLKFRNSETLRTRVIECASVDSHPEGLLTYVSVALDADRKEHVILGPGNDFDIVFVTDFSGYTVQVIRAGAAKYLARSPRSNGSAHDAT